MGKNPLDRNALDLFDDDLLDGLVAEQPDEPAPEPPARRTTPHERGRQTRRLSITFPSAAWRTVVDTLAEQWNARPADVMVYALAHLMAAIEQGQQPRPTGRVEFHHRAGQAFDLPWQPQGDL